MGFLMITATTLYDDYIGRQKMTYENPFQYNAPCRTKEDRKKYIYNGTVFFLFPTVQMGAENINRMIGQKSSFVHPLKNITWKHNPVSIESI